MCSHFDLLTDGRWLQQAGKTPKRWVAEEPKAEAEKPKEQQGKAEVEKPKEEEKSKKEKPKPEEKKDDSKPKGE